MKSTLLFLASFFALLIVFSPQPALSQELRIIDNIGLTRAVKRIEQPSRVVVEIRSQDHLQVRLVHSEGFYPELPGRRDNSTYIFSEVPAGTWRIAMPAEHTILRVRIE